jgi:hypothetical protein
LRVDACLLVALVDGDTAVAIPQWPPAVGAAAGWAKKARGGHQSKGREEEGRPSEKGCEEEGRVEKKRGLGERRDTDWGMLCTLVLSPAAVSCDPPKNIPK